jgi:hypothetical protein
MMVNCVDCNCYIDVPFGVMVDIELECREEGTSGIEFMCQSCEAQIE